MKLTHIDFAALLISVLILSAFVFWEGGTIKGKVTPAENAVRVLAISGKDTINASITSGHIELSKLKAGVYQMWIEATAPYQHKLIPEVSVKDNEITNVGEIQLELKK
jgi:hypothetical protein